MTELQPTTPHSFLNSGIRAAGIDLMAADAAEWTAVRFNTLTDIGANAARIWLTLWETASGYVVSAEEWERFDQTISMLTTLGVYAIPVIAVSDRSTPWSNSTNAKQLTKVWSWIAGKLKGNNTVAGFDLFNEPKAVGVEQTTAYWTWVEATVDAIQAIDPARVCIVETCPEAGLITDPSWGEWVRFVPGTVISAHLYNPHSFTHNGVADWAQPWQPFSHETLHQQHAALLRLKEKSLDLQLPVFIGEFSANQTLQGSDRWARHALQLMRGFGFSWSWHFLHGDPVWHPSDSTMALMKQYY
jgi:aryl-phospho-beta-D-glucosidase BglC (GH1 family)